MKRVYLLGSEQYYDDYSWKAEAKQLLSDIGMSCFLPNDFEYESTEEMMEMAMHEMKQCNVVLVNLADTCKSAKVGYLIAKAEEYGFAIVGITGTFADDWINACCISVRSNLADAIDYINYYYNN